MNHNLSNPLFLIFISSVLYFIKNIKSEKSANAAVIITKGSSIDEWIEVSLRRFIEAGWWRVDHQSTENLIIGTLITPNIAIYELNLTALSSVPAILQDKINIK